MVDPQPTVSGSASTGVSAGAGAAAAELLKAGVEPNCKPERSRGERSANSLQIVIYTLIQVQRTTRGAPANTLVDA